MEPISGSASGEGTNHCPDNTGLDATEPNRSAGSWRATEPCGGPRREGGKVWRLKAPVKTWECSHRCLPYLAVLSPDPVR